MAATRWRLGHVVVLVAPTIAPALAYADDADDRVRDAAVVAVDRTPVLETSLGFETGTFPVGASGLLGNGFAAEAGVRLNRLTWLGSYSRLVLSPDENSEGVGSLHRLGLAARYELDRLRGVGHGKGWRVSLWVEGGLGGQLVRWYGDGTLVRPDLELAIGGELTVRGAHRHAGVFLGLRTMLSPSPASPMMATPAVCGAVCEPRPTSLSNITGVDQSVLLTIAATLGG